MGKINCEEHRKLSDAIKAVGHEANLLREMLSGNISLTLEQKAVLNGAMVADQNEIIELVRTRSAHSKGCEECKTEGMECAATPQ